MRERTPSADDTPKRAPPAPSREAAVAGSETPNDDTIEAYHTAKLATISDSISDATSSSDRMVASMQSLEDLAVNHSANATGSNGDRQQQQQERYGHAYKSAQTAQDKRSRLSNVINNLRKKVPDGTAKGNAESPRKEEDDRNSVERNLETLEKYVMTVLNGVIKDNEEEDKGTSVENTKEPERRRKDADDDENPTGTKSESSNEGDIEAAAVPCLEDSSKIGNAESSKMADCSNTKGAMEESIEVSEVKLNQDSKELSSRTEEEHLDIEKEESLESDRDISREKKENRTLGAIIMDRLSEHQVEERANVDDGRGEDRRDEHVISENMEVRAICTELLDELLNDVHLTIDNQKSQQRVEECEKIKEVSDTAESKVEDIKDSNSKVQESTTKSLHCSLPLDKVASVLQNCQTSESMASRLSSGSPLNAPSTQKSKSSSSTSPPVRLLCLYCDRKFSSISLRQRHTERVHQLGGRRSERNSRKPSQNCQYCSEKCADTLETLFQHMISNHGDKYHACIQCLTRYPTREALTGHMNETHSGNTERSTSQVQPEKIKEGSPCKEFCNREKVNVSSVKERISEEKELETSQGDSRQSDSTRTKLIATRDSIDNPASPEFDSSFYSNVSCNIRENLLHHLDGKLQTIGSSSACSSSITVSGTTTTTMTESKSQQQQQPPQQSYYEHSVNQVQFQSPIDISLTAATPVYSKDYSAGEEYENSSEYARKAGKTSSGSRPRRVSFEKYNFPRKYDGREQWTCSIRDLSKFDISTQLSLRKKQQLIKERLTINRLHQIPLMSCETTEVSLRDGEHVESVVEPAASNQDNVDGGCSVNAAAATLDVVSCDPGEPLLSEIKKETTEELSAATLSSRSTKSFITAEFTIEFADFMRLNRREESGNEANIEKIIYAELSGEWSRTRIYICGACGSKHMTLKEMEDHKASTHPRVLCSHFELTGDQREHYTHLYLPGQNKPTDEARDATLKEMMCTKCKKIYLNVVELHRHMLECGGDHAWLLGLTGSGKRKCKWRPFGSRSRRRRQRGMKRNIQNSQTQPRIVNAEQRPKEKQTPTGPRVRPSDRESIQKMLANLPAKRATRKVLQDNAMRSQGKLRNVQTRTRPRIIGDNSSVSRISRNKAALRNKLLKNAKSIQRNRCRSDNITAVIESVVKKCHETEKRSDGDGKNVEVGDENKRDVKEINEVFLASKTLDSNVKVVRPKAVGRPRILDKKAKIGMKRKLGNSQFQDKDDDKLANLKAKGKSGKFKSIGTLSETKSDVKGEETSSPKNTPKNSKTTSRTTNKGIIGPGKKRISVLGIRNKKKTMQGALKRKRSADPTTSYLKASLKAKSQLRTQDGKFARNPNKEAPTKSSELKMDDGKHKTVSSVESKLLKPKAIQKLKKAKVKLPRRVTRLSSDSDKMPTLEPAMQIVSPNEDDADKSTNDLPILSPVTSSGSLQDQKTLRTSAKHVSKEKEGNTETNTEVAPEKSTKEQKSTRGRKPKQEPKNTAKRKEEIVEENEISKNNSMMLKERKTKIRKTLHTKNINNGENSKEETSKGEVNVKKDLKSKKEETKETRSNSKSKIEKDSMKLPDIPFEVKKLLGSASKEDLLNTLEIASNDTGSKRSLRQSTPRSKPLQANDKSPRELDEELDSSKGAGKKEKVEAIRKSSRKNVEKKDDEKMVKTINLEKDIKDATNNVTQNERNQQSKKETRANAKSKETDSTDIEYKIDSRQTRRSLIEARSEPSSEVTSSSSQKASGLSGKRRSRIKSIDEETNTHVTQKQNNSENVIPSEKETQKKEEFEETIDKNETEGDNNNCDNRDSMMMNLNLSHLQSETSNLSVDSGKENSLETSVNVHNKLKVTRPKKTWGARRERSSRKRSLNNVIGILTEGINIPVEQSVQVLTVQTSLDNPERVTRNGNTQQPVGEDNVTTVLARNEQESTENEVVATNVNDNHADDEKNARSCIDKTQDENAFADQTDTSSKVSTAKVNSPTNDIILDLSRRKSKGKGSYLEKIVSKIAKQKDALLEGEVGSLLDNAADELTSILDEVGPALADNAECASFGEVSYASKNENNESTSITSTSSNKKSPIIAISENRSENDAIIKNATAERSTDLMIQDNHEENLATRIEVKSKNQTKVNDVSDAETKDNYVVDRQVSDTMRSVEESQVESCENKSATNEEAIIPMEIPDETPSSLTDTLTEISISSITTQKLNAEKLEKKESGVKSRRKSSKRSLEDASWSKKSKRKLLEVVEDFDEKDMQKEFRLDNIIASIPKQKEMFNVRHELEKEDKTMKISEIDAKVEKFQHSESKDLELSSLEKILAEDDESNLERFANLPEAAYEEAAELTSNLEEAVNKIISDDEVVEANTEAIELIEENIESSTLKKTVKSEKSKDRTRKKNQRSESVRRTSKRKSQSLSSVLQTSVKPINELLSSSCKEDSLEFTDEIKIEITNENDILEKSLYTIETTSKKRDEIQIADNLTSSKITRKQATKKKSLADEHLTLPEDKPAEVTSKFNEGPNVADSIEQLSASLEPFKIPEVKDLLQSVKKRGPKKKVLLEDDRCNGKTVSEESWINEELAEVNEMSNLIEKVEEQIEFKEHIQEQLITKTLERSSSSGSIGLTPSVVKTRSMFKKTQLSSEEDLAVASIRSQDAESTDDLSESSCASESSYFRRKRFAKRKRKEEIVAHDNEEVDSITLNSDKENLNEEAAKVKSLLDEHLDLSDVDDLDIPMDIEASLENTKALESIEREFELAEKSAALQNEADTPVDDTPVNDAPVNDAPVNDAPVNDAPVNDASVNNAPVNDAPVNDVPVNDTPSTDKSSNKDATTEQTIASNLDSLDDALAPKKRTAGNFVVVHTKTGEILIVEKRKKLTKEAAKFYCDVCATSFTRNSSLKKHTQSQSHLQMKSTKDKLEPTNNSTQSENVKETDKEKSDQVSDRNAKGVSNDGRAYEIIPKTSNESYTPYVVVTESLDLGVMKQETLEDKLLDEEICKITENMSHEEYVLTDQVTPEEPISSSTPKQIQKKQDESEQNRSGDKKLNKKKKNLAEEHLLLDSPDLEEFKFDPNELASNTVNHLVQNSSSPSYEHSSTKEIVQTEKETKDVPEEIHFMDSAETKKEMDSIVESLNDEVDYSKLLCDTEMKDEQHIESTRTTRSTLKKVGRVDNDKKEENETSSETTRFSLRPRRNKNIQHYEESDVEADIYFIDVSMQMNNDEMETSYDSLKRQNEAEQEISKDPLEETTDIENRSFQDAEVVKSKPESTNESTKKRKRGRPRIRDRIVSNSSATSAHGELEVSENEIATSNFEESKIKDQKLISHTKEHLDEAGKSAYSNANIHPPKRSRGRPRKNPVQNATNLSIQAEDSSASESMKSKCNEVVKEETGQIESEKVASTTLVNSSASNDEFFLASKNHIRESQLSETEKDELKVDEENEIPFIKVNTSDDQSMQEVESTNIKIADIFTRNCDTLAFNIPSEKNEAVDTSEINENADDGKVTSEDKSDNDTSANISNNSTAESLTECSSQITEKVSTIIDDLKSIESIRTNELESCEIQKPSNISEEKQTKSGKEHPEVEIFQKETKLESQSENSEDEVTDDKSLLITTPSELLAQKTIDDLEIDSIHDKRTSRTESSSKRLFSGSSQSAGKERETGRRKSKVSRGRKKKTTVAKITELSSDSENEFDGIESASSSKSKIVKSVFGRVFGGEKADKVKEVLNDWVSRSEDDSDISRSASEARSCLRGPTKISENGHKKDKKRHSSSDTKKDAELSPRKKGSDKSNNLEVHGKLKNRRKREKDLNTTLEDPVESPINPVKRRHRESKIRADERILRTFDSSESLILWENDEDVNEIKEMSSQFDDDCLSKKDDELGRYHEDEWKEERTKDRNPISTDWENLQVDHDAYGKSKNSSNRKKQDAHAKNERSSSPSQFNMFKCRQRESKTKAGERIWKAFDNETSSCLFDQDLNEIRKNFKEQESEFHESGDLDRLNNSKSVKHKDDDTWKDSSFINEEQIEAQNARGKSKKDSNNRKKQDFNTIDKTKTDDMISKNSDNSDDSPIALRNQKTKDEMQNDQTTRSTSESRNRFKNLTVKDNTYECFADINHQSTNSRKSKKGIASEDWKLSMKNLEFDQKDLAKDDQPIEKEKLRQKHEVSAILSHSNLAGPVVKDQFADLDVNSQAIRESDNDDEEEEQENNDDDDDDDDDDLGRRRMSPFYACETPRDSSIDSSSNNEEDEDEDGDEEERMTHEDTSRKNSSEFSGEKIVIRSPSSGHRSDVVTIAPTDAIEDNALDVPREIESMTEPRQGKILNFDEELFVECCSRLKATSENELRGAKKIKLDHTESYHRRDDQPQGFRVNRDRWRDVESQNSLGSLLESVNQLLGEEMCNSYDKSYRTRGSEQSSRSASPDASRVDNLSYEDSLDVAFQHNNKLRDKIQQRMRESENLIASTFGSQKTDDNDHPDDDKRGSIRNSSYSSSIHEQEQLSTSIASNRERVPSPGHKNKVNSTLGGLVDKALSNLLHSNGKHDHNGSAPMKLLAELACARAPTSTSPEDTTNSGKNHQSAKMVAAAVAAAAAAAATATKDTSDLSKKPTKGSTVVKTSQTKKTRNPIKELFERKKEINDRKDQERSKATQESNVQKPRKPKRGKKQQQQQEFPLIRRNELYGGLMEKKKRRDSFDRKGDSERIKDVYEFDEEESQTAPPLGSVMSYRSQVDKSYDSNWLKKDIDEDLGALENGKTNYIADTKLDAIIDRKFQELEKFAPKTKGALKSFQSEEQQQQQQVADPIIGPMDDFVERKQQRLKRLEQSVKQPSKLKKRGKSPKKRARNAWYENDSSDEFRTAAKAEDVGVGISKSQRACSKGKQNLFAELSTSSESEYEREEDADYVIANEQQPPSSKSRKSLKKQLDVDADEMNCDQHVINESKFENEDQIANCDWENQMAQKNAVKKDYEVAKSESEMSDRSLVIDERKTIDEARNSDDEADNQYERTFELEDLYREDSSETETEVEGNEEPTSMAEEAKDRVETQALDDENVTLQSKITSNMKDDYTPENELIPLEEALDFLDRHEDLEPKSETVRLKVQTENDSVNDDMIDTVNEASNDGIVNVDEENKHLNHTETQDEKEEPDDDVPALPEKLSSNEKPQKESDNNLPLHVFLSRKVQESKKRKQQQLDKLREEQERILMDFQPTRRQRKCAIGKQGLLAEISSSDEESYARDNSKRGNDHDKSRKKRESKEKRKERYLEKKHEQMFAKEQKAIEEQILREVGKRNKIVVQSTDVDTEETKVVSGQIHKKKYQSKEKQKKSSDENIEKTAQHISSTNQSPLGSSEDIYSNLKSVFPSTESTIENNGHLSMSSKRKKLSKSPVRLKKVPKLGENGKIPASKKTKESSEKSKRTSVSNNKDSKERRSSGGKHDSDDEELKTTKSWNKVEEGVGVAIGRRKRTAVLQQLYYWSSSSDEEEAPEPVLVPEEEEDDRQEQHGWIVGDSHKRMITMLAMEKQQKEKRRRSEDEFESGKTKSKKHRNSTS